MSLEAQYSALYALFYKRRARDAFFQPGHAPVAGLTDAELRQLQLVDGLRFDTVVGLHQGDLAHQWYASRVPASWLALQVALDTDDRELVASFTGSDAFELRVDDDADGRALLAWVDALVDSGNLPDAPWLPDLLRYELLLNARWIGAHTPRVEEFKFEVPGIRESLIERRTFPTEEDPVRYGALFHKDERGVGEVALDRDEARAMRAVLAGSDTSGEPPRLLKRCKALLREMSGW
ncbi:MAG: hypothetical protein IPK87_01265 [Planctomycetes bacterium]|nr:hypothetical protein [Planctomycetota bacterium]